MEKGYPVIDREKCIKCYCCQEFCPVGAMRVKTNILNKILNRRFK
jgi:formate hydrogenlyase subunit 6/NADH:ubiquinone oxidoreductase subunit I